MIVGNATQEQIESAALQAGVRIVNFRAQGRRWAFTLGLQGELWRRLGQYQGRRLAYVCFHGHARFMQELYNLQPDALIVTKLERYTDVHDFRRKACEVGEINIGSRMDPTRFNEACVCTGDQTEARL